MNISKLITSASLAFAIVGGSMVLTPSSAVAAGKKGDFISYGALNKNRVPCSKRGGSHVNCSPGAQANPYKRGCSKASGCARG
jgi:hypothetical protein